MDYDACDRAIHIRRLVDERDVWRRAAAKHEGAKFAVENERDELLSSLRETTTMLSAYITGTGGRTELGVVRDQVIGEVVDRARALIAKPRGKV